MHDRDEYRQYASGWRAVNLDEYVDQFGICKQFKTFIHKTASGHDKIFVSAGRVGAQIEINPADLIGIVGCVEEDII